jgi:hypothetical protein
MRCCQYCWQEILEWEELLLTYFKLDNVGECFPFFAGMRDVSDEEGDLLVRHGGCEK